jgi:hypothetical protein
MYTTERQNSTLQMIMTETESPKRADFAAMKGFETHQERGGKVVIGNEVEEPTTNQISNKVVFLTISC